LAPLSLPSLTVQRLVEMAVSSLNFNAELVPGASNEQVFVHDQATGVTTLASGTGYGTPSEGYAWRPTVSANGRFVAFYSTSVLAPEDSGGNGDTYVRDLRKQTIEIVDVDNLGNPFPQGTNLFDTPAISADGRFVAFVVVNDYIFDVFVRDRKKRTTKLISVSTDGVRGNSLSFGPTMSADGRTIAFTSSATNLSPMKNSAAYLDVYVRARQKH
jgi:TolB protein